MAEGRHASRLRRAVACLGIAAALGLGAAATLPPAPAWAAEQGAEITSGVLVAQNQPTSTASGACSVDVYTAGALADGQQAYRAVFHPGEDGSANYVPGTYLWGLKALDGSPLNVYNTSITEIEFKADAGAKLVYNQYDLTFISYTSLKKLDGLANLDMDKVSSVQYGFRDLKSLEAVDLSGVSLPNVTGMQGLFYNASGLKKVTFGDFFAPKVTTTYALFYGCGELETVDLGTWDTSSVTYMESMFDGTAKLKSVDFAGLDTSKVISFRNLFARSGIENFSFKDVEVGAVTNYAYMFVNCPNLKTVDMSNLVVAKPADEKTLVYMDSMFGGCPKLESINMQNVDTSSATSVMSMFYSCTSLRTLDLSDFDIDGAYEKFEIKDYNYPREGLLWQMFNGCTNLRQIKGLDKFFKQDKSVKTFAFLGAFNNASALTKLDLEKANTENVAAFSFTNTSNAIWSSLNGMDDLVELRLGTKTGSGDRLIGSRNYATFTPSWSGNLGPDYTQWYVRSGATDTLLGTKGEWSDLATYQEKNGYGKSAQTYVRYFMPHFYTQKATFDESAGDMATFAGSAYKDHLVSVKLSDEKSKLIETMKPDMAMADSIEPGRGIANLVLPDGDLLTPPADSTKVFYGWYDYSKASAEGKHKSVYSDEYKINEDHELLPSQRRGFDLWAGWKYLLNYETYTNERVEPQEGFPGEELPLQLIPEEDPATHKLIQKPGAPFKPGAVFVGWSDKDNDGKVFTSRPQLIEKKMIGDYSYGKPETVYAVFASDINENGIPDYYEPWTLTFDTNGGSAVDGTVKGSKYNPQTGSYDGVADHAVTENKVESLFFNSTAYLPMENTAKNGKCSTKQHAVLMGWSYTDPGEEPIATKEEYETFKNSLAADDPMRRINDTYKGGYLTMSGNKTVHAVWALDADDCGVADFEEYYNLTYHRNMSPDDTTTSTSWIYRGQETALGSAWGQQEIDGVISKGVGWATEADGMPKFGFGERVTIPGHVDLPIRDVPQPNGTIRHEIDLYQVWNPTGDALYKVEHYRQDANGTWPTSPSYTQTLEGKSGATVWATPHLSTGGWSHWLFDPDHKDTVASATLADNGTTVLKLYYRYQSFVTFQTVGGQPEPADQKVMLGLTAHKPAPNPTRTGSQFLGWHLVQDDGTLAKTPYDFNTPVNTDITLRAAWDPADYTIAFDGNAPDVTGSMESISTTYGTQVDLPQCGFHRDGYVFEGWSTTPEGIVRYADASKVQNLTDKDGDTVTLYAHWRKAGNIAFKVEHYVQDPDGSWPSDPTKVQDFANGTTGGWVTAAPLSSIDLQLDKGEAVFDEDNEHNVRRAAVKTDGSTVLKLYYNRVFTVSFKTDCDSVYVPSQRVIAGETAKAPSSVKRPGYYPIPTSGKSYWHTADAPDTAYDFGTKVHDDLELTAPWAPYTYTVTFNANGGSDAPAAMKVEFGTKDADARKLPDGSGMKAPADKVFMGWALKNDDHAVWRAGDAMLSDADLLYADPLIDRAENQAFTLYAVWVDATFTVEYDLGGGVYDGKDTVPSREVDFDAANLLPGGADYTADKLVKRGHHLDPKKPWVYGDGDAAKPVDANTTYASLVDNDKTVDSILIKPVWVANRYKVKFDANAPAAEVQGEMKDQQFTYGVEDKLTANAYQRSGYTFAGWRTEQGADAGTLYADQAAVENLTDVHDGTMTLYAQWKRADALWHPISYRFEVIDGGRDLPSVEQGGPQLPTAPTEGVEGTQIAVPQGYKAVANEYGTWTFVGWKVSDKPVDGSVTMGSGLLEFVGEWKFEANTAKATYEFKSGTDGHDLPKGVLDQLPATSEHNVGDTVAAPLPETMKPVLDGIGAWTFVEWDHASQTMDADGVTFVGTWVWAEGDPQPVTHSFVSGTDGHELPQSVLDLVPASSSAYEGQTVTAPAMDTTTVVDGPGTWTFAGWDHDSQIMDADGLTFVGTWVWAENPRHAVDYVFVPDQASQDAGRKLPQGVLDQLPAASDAPEGATVAVPEDSYKPVKDNGGTWTFVKWDPESQTMDADGVTFTGTWVWTEGQTPEPGPDPDGGDITLPGVDGKPGTGDDVVVKPSKPGATVDPDGGIELPGGGVIVTPGGEIELPGGTVIGPDGTATMPDGTVVKPDGTVVKPDGTIVKPGDGANGDTDNGSDNKVPLGPSSEEKLAKTGDASLGMIAVATVMGASSFAAALLARRKRR